MAITTFRIEGLAELSEALATELPKATQTTVLKRVMIKAATPIANEAKRNAPYKTGTLQQKIDIGARLSQRQRSISSKLSKVEIYVGPPSMPRAIVAEFGSVKQSPHPFMRPAWDGNKRSAFNSLRDDLAKEIEQAAQRIARKNARQIAKAKSR